MVSQQHPATKRVEQFVRRLGRRQFRLAWWITQRTWRSRHRPRELRYKRDILFKLASAEEPKFITALHCTVKTYFTMESGGHTSGMIVDVHVIKESGPYEPSKNGKWGVNPVSFLKMVPNGQQRTT
jgi:hypothetical protein